MHPSVWMLVLAAAGLAVIHAVLPDHWMPLAVVGRAERWPISRAAKVATWAGAGHVAGSLLLGAVLVVVGLGVGSLLRAESWIVGSILIATGLGFFLWGRFRGSPHHHHADEAHKHTGTQRRGLSLFIPAGIAASPDPTILPVFLAAATLGLAAATAVVAAYALMTLLTFITLTTLAVAGGYRLDWPWLETHAETVTSAVLVLMGVAAIAAF